MISIHTFILMYLGAGLLRCLFLFSKSYEDIGVLPKVIVGYIFMVGWLFFDICKVLHFLMGDLSQYEAPPKG